MSPGLADWTQAFRPKGRPIRSVFEELDDQFEPVEINQLVRCKLPTEFIAKGFCIGVADAEGDQGSDVAEDGLADG